MYYLIYVERPYDSGSKDTVSPEFFTRRKQAIDKLSNYALNRLADCGLMSQFVEEHADMLSIELGLDREVATDQQIVDQLLVADDDKRLHACNWYFEYMDDEAVEAFYELNEVKPSPSVEQLAVEEIAGVMSASEWSPDTLDSIAEIIRGAGYSIEDCVD